MKKIIATILVSALPLFGHAAYPLDKVDIDLRDKAAMQDGLKNLCQLLPGLPWHEVSAL
jgi:ubiquinol-cytochrome c reductase cytochrome c1 subunit